MNNEPRAITLMKAKIDFERNNHGKLTVKDGDEVQAELDICCMEHNYECGRLKECFEIQDTVAGLLPPVTYEKVYSNKRENWVPQADLKPYAKRRRERMYC